MSMVLAEKAILVGDHRQLPPLFGDKEPKGLSEIMQQQEEASVPEAQRITKESFSKYQGMVEASLFKQHFEQADDRLKSRLWYQYRMHPDIQNLVNLFYENRLVCGIDKPDEARNHLQSPERIPWMRHEGHAYWIDSSTDPDGVPFLEVSRIGSTSKENPLEVKLMFKALVDLDNSLDAYARTLPPDLAKNVKKTVGIISFYGLQVRALAKEFKRHQFKRLKCRNPATVDRFQGQECDYILVSMTRHPARKQNLSHVAKFERINVAFSRARELLLIFGARDVFVDCDVWLPPLDRPGKPERKPVYRQMVDLLTREGRFLSSRELITRDQWKALAPTITRGEGGHEPAEGRRGQPRAGGYGAWGGGFKGHVRHHFHK
jgi:superfamily I DNA and/or RNA helicase